MIFYRSILFILLTNIYLSVSKMYDKFTLYRGIPVNEMHLNYFRNLSTMYDVKFWREPGMQNKPIEFMISPNDKQFFLYDVEILGLYVTTVIENVQEAFDQQTVKSYIRRRTETFDWNNYFRLDDIYNWIKDLSKVYPRQMQVNSIGRTVERRDILSLKINLQDPRSDTLEHWNATKTKIIIEGGIHAREWISIAFVTYLINAILHAPFSNNPDLKRIAFLYEWHFVPVLNPDGYEYTHTNDRMWRKNRNKGHFGVDINRNFGYNFGTKGVSFEESEEIYCGPSAFSENESRAMSNFVKSNSNNLGFYFAFHSYGQYIIIPYADSKLHVENYDEVKSMAITARKQISKRYGTAYSVGTAFDTVGYMTSGISGDWVKSSFGVKVVCTFELRDNGRYGFALPPSLILPTCKETLDGMISFLSPRKKGELEGMRNKPLLSSQMRKLLDTFVIVCNFVLFIIVRFG